MLQQLKSGVVEYFMGFGLILNGDSCSGDAYVTTVIM